MLNKWKRGSDNMVCWLPSCNIQIIYHGAHEQSKQWYLKTWTSTCWGYLGFYHDCVPTFLQEKNQPKLQYGTMLRANQPASSCIVEGGRICLQWAKYSVTGLFPLLGPLLTLSILIPPEGLIHHHSTLTKSKEFISQHKVGGLGWCPMWPLGLGSNYKFTFI